MKKFLLTICMLAFIMQAIGASCGGDANNPVLTETINVRQGQSLSFTYNAKNPDGVTSPVPEEQLDILVISKPVWITAEPTIYDDPNVVVVEGETSPCDLLPVLVVETKTASRKFVMIVPDNAAGTYSVVIALTDNYPNQAAKYFQVNIRVNRAPFGDVAVD